MWRSLAARLLWDYPALNVMLTWDFPAKNEA
jgi:hypothetical protein